MYATYIIYYKILYIYFFASYAGVSCCIGSFLFLCEPFCSGTLNLDPIYFVVFLNHDLRWLTWQLDRKLQKQR